MHGQLRVNGNENGMIGARPEFCPAKYQPLYDNVLVQIFENEFGLCRARVLALYLRRDTSAIVINF